MSEPKTDAAVAPNHQKDELVASLKATLDLYHRAQVILFSHLPPDGPDETTTINNLLSLLDGSEQRVIVSAAKKALGQEPIPGIITTEPTPEQETRMLEIARENQEALEETLSNLHRSAPD